MDEFIKLLDENFKYISHEIIENIIYIDVISVSDKIACPHCGETSNKVHSHYKKSFQDLPIQGKKVKVTLNNRKMFCKNSDCKYTTFAEEFNFILPRAKKTKRLDNEIVNLSMNVSSLTATKLLKNGIADVGKSTICNLLKKNNSQYK